MSLEESNTSIRSFGDLGQKLNREGTMDNTSTATDTAPVAKARTNYSPLPEYKAKTKYYNHNKRFGFMYVTIPEGTTLDFEIKSSSIDDSPGATYSKGETLTRPVVIEAFIHGSVIEKAGYREGLIDGQELTVKIALQQKGVQVVDTTHINGRRPLNNEPRPCNAELAFVDSTVKTYYADKRFGFIVVSSDPKTGKPLPDGETRDVHFNYVSLERAGYADGVEAGQQLQVRYWKYSDGKSSVVQFKFKEGFKPTYSNRA